MIAHEISCCCCCCCHGYDESIASCEHNMGTLQDLYMQPGQNLGLEPRRWPPSPLQPCQPAFWAWCLKKCSDPRVHWPADHALGNDIQDPQHVAYRRRHPKLPFRSSRACKKQLSLPSFQSPVLHAASAVPFQSNAARRQTLHHMAPWRATSSSCLRSTIHNLV